jgi:hypothetical protein
VLSLIVFVGADHFCRIPLRITCNGRVDGSVGTGIGVVVIIQFASATTGSGNVIFRGFGAAAAAAADVIVVIVVLVIVVLSIGLLAACTLGATIVVLVAPLASLVAPFGSNGVSHPVAAASGSGFITARICSEIIRVHIFQVALLINAALRISQALVSLDQEFPNVLREIARIRGVRIDPQTPHGHDESPQVPKWASLVEVLRKVAGL